jgi:beta-glucosidase-like glycosyl hydrolase
LDKKRKVSDFALEFLRGMNDVGILGCLKHFPGHGNTNVDSAFRIAKKKLEELVANGSFS